MERTIRALIIGATNDIKYGATLLKDYQITTIAIDGNPNAPGFQYVDEAYCIDITNNDLVEKFVKEQEIDFILPVPIGRYLTTTGFINSTFNLKGLKAKAAINCTDKWLFHTTLQKKGLRKAAAYLINNNNELPKENQLTFPMILKPRHGSGSRNVTSINTYNELVESTKNLDLTEDYILEKEIIGVEFGVDGMVMAGAFSLILLREKKNTPPPHKQALGYYSTYDEIKFPNLFSRVEKHLSSIIKELAIDNTLFHADIIVNDDIFVIELSGRPSGHNLHNNFTIKATGFNMLAEYINFQIGQPYNLKVAKNKTLMIHYFDFENVEIIAVPEKAELLKNTNILEYHTPLKSGDLLGVIDCGAEIMKRGYVILQAKNREELQSEFEKIKMLFKIKGR